MEQDHSSNPTPPRAILPVVERLINVYKIWQEILKLFPKTAKYSLGIKIDHLLVEIIESTSAATFLQKTEKAPWIRRAILKLDTANVLLRVAWETKSLDDKKYVRISEPLSEIGKMLGGWLGQSLKQNPAPKK